MAEKKECTGSEIYGPRLKTIDLCYKACKGKASMFAYGLAPTRCGEDGCRCLCETSSTNGKCTMTDHSGYNLYAYRPGEIVNIRNHMAVRVILIHHMSYFLTILK